MIRSKITINMEVLCRMDMSPFSKYNITVFVLSSKEKKDSNDYHHIIIGGYEIQEEDEVSIFEIKEEYIEDKEQLISLIYSNVMSYFINKMYRKISVEEYKETEEFDNMYFLYIYDRNNHRTTLVNKNISTICNK